MKILYVCDRHEGFSRFSCIKNFFVYSWDFSVVKWLRLHAANAGGMGSIPGQRTKIPHAMQCSQKIKIN